MPLTSCSEIMSTSTTAEDLRADTNPSAWKTLLK